MGLWGCGAALRVLLGLSWAPLAASNGRGIGGSSSPWGVSGVGASTEGEVGSSGLVPPGAAPVDAFGPSEELGGLTPDRVSEGHGRPLSAISSDRQSAGSAYVVNQLRHGVEELGR